MNFSARMLSAGGHDIENILLIPLVRFGVAHLTLKSTPEAASILGLTIFSHSTVLPVFLAMKAFSFSAMIPLTTEIPLPDRTL